MTDTWHSVWERKGAAFAGKQANSEDDLFAANGYDTPLGVTSDRSRRHMLQNIVDALAITAGKSLLEVGCGSGALLSMLRHTGAQLAGVDFSASLVELGRRSLACADIRIAEATALPFPPHQFDAVLCQGVFLYFPDLPYATAALEEMLRVCRANGRLYIGDIPDLDKKESCLQARRAAGSSLTPEHLYYPKLFFQDFADAHALRATIADQNIPDYANTPFRFNVLFEQAAASL